VEEYLDPTHSTPLSSMSNVKIVGFQGPVSVFNNEMSMVPQLSEEEFTGDESVYSINTDEDYQPHKHYEEWKSESFINNKPTNIYKSLDIKDDNTNDQSINSNEFGSNPYDNTYISTDKQEVNIEDQLNDQQVLENKERIINGYKAMKKILYMLHDYASSTFDWIINKINYQMKLVSS